MPSLGIDLGFGQWSVSGPSVRQCVCAHLSDTLVSLNLSHLIHPPSPFPPPLFHPQNVLASEFEYGVPLGLLWRWLPSVCMSVAMQLFSFLLGRELAFVCETDAGRVFFSPVDFRRC